uniref:DUF4346 domain-containing protein n=1 Tax=Sebdenia flabellata TaxID=42024 RepID=A0A1C9C9V2_9FLOR|nr:hypothetical protein Sebd_076 [Sebdenia flabellata]AOM65163.1 hypothetical protein Sebd_076 [Sebdenia flabellata]
MDNYYCTIRILNNKKISLYLWESEQNSKKMFYPICFTAAYSDLLYNLICSHYYLNDLSINHLLYIGQELYKAELSLTLNQKYIQD